MAGDFLLFDVIRHQRLRRRTGGRHAKKFTFSFEEIADLLHTCERKRVDRDRENRCRKNQVHALFRHKTKTLAEARQNK